MAANQHIWNRLIVWKKKPCRDTIRCQLKKHYDLNPHTIDSKFCFSQFTRFICWHCQRWIHLWSRCIYIMSAHWLEFRKRIFFLYHGEISVWYCAIQNLNSTAQLVQYALWWPVLAECLLRSFVNHLLRLYNNRKRNTHLTQPCCSCSRGLYCYIDLMQWQAC